MSAIRLRQTVSIFEAKPNKMFTEEQRELVRFLRYSGATVPCAECGKRKATHWTMLCSFQAVTITTIVPLKSGKVHIPLTPVCQSHLLAPEYDEVAAPEGGAR